MHGSYFLCINIFVRDTDKGSPCMFICNLSPYIFIGNVSPYIFYWQCDPIYFLLAVCPHIFFIGNVSPYTFCWQCKTVQVTNRYRGFWQEQKRMKNERSFFPHDFYDQTSVGIVLLMSLQVSNSDRPIFLYCNIDCSHMTCHESKTCVFEYV